MRLGPLEHQRRAKLLRKKAQSLTSLPEKQKWLKRAGFHQAVARAQARNPDLLPKPESKESPSSSSPAPRAASMTTPRSIREGDTAPIFGSTPESWEQYLEYLRSLPAQGLEAEIKNAGGVKTTEFP